LVGEAEMWESGKGAINPFQKESAGSVNPERMQGKSTG